MTTMEARRNLDTVLAELAEELRHERATMTEVVGHLRSQTANDLLLVNTAIFPTIGYVDHAFGSPYGSVQVSNHSSAGTVVVSADPPQSGAPNGRGAYRVGPGCSAVINLHGRALTLYGTAGERVSYQVFTRAWPPFATGPDLDQAAGFALPAIAEPATPATGGILYVDVADGALKYKGSAGTVTVIGPP